MTTMMSVTTGRGERLEVPAEDWHTTQTEESLRPHLVRTEAAMATFEAARATLFTPNGSKIFSDPQHAAREAALIAARDAAFASALAAVDQVTHEAEAIIDAEENSDPLSRLSEGELSRASAMKLFVESDVAALPMAQVRDRLKRVMEGSDLAVLFVWRRAAAERLARLDAGEQPSAGVSEEDARAFGDTRTLLREAGERFIDVRGLATARGRLEGARRTRRAVMALRREELVQAAMAEMRASGQYAAL